MAGQRLPIEVVQARGSKHLTKAEIQERQEREIKPITDDIIAPSYLTKKQLEYLTSKTGQGAFFRVGTGKSAETVDDYKLDTDVSENFELIGILNDTINFGRAFTCLFKNISNTDIIINEVGLFMKMYGKDYPQCFNNSVCCLLARTVLETPITIKSGETQVLNYTLNV